ncbi:MAG: HAMP domain-containing sensor histidine kinase, partial [Pseudomonadota bacterium]
DSPAADAHLRGALHDVVSEADRLIVTFNALLNISRLEAGAGHLELEPVDLRELVTDIAETYEPVADEAGARLTVTMPAGQNPVMSQGNGALLAQLLANLLDNALKYGQPAPPPGAAAGARDAALIAPEIGVVLDSRPDRLIIEIADNGPGIAPEDRARAFDRFTRLDASRSAPGSGLGMSLALAIARLHAGELSLHDNGPGLRVRLALPRPAER